MRIAILGATGNYGKKFVSELIKKTNHKLTLISKHATNYYKNSDRIVAKNVDATNLEALKKVLEGHDIVYSAISGYDLPSIASNLTKINIKRLIFMAAVGIYNELVGSGARFNVNNEAPQVPNKKAVDILEKSKLNYTILRPGFLIDGKENDYVISKKGQTPKGYRSTIPSVIKVALEIIERPELYSLESISITQDMS